MWKENKNILAGKDLEKGGIWLGVNIEKQRFSVLTNYRNPKLLDDNNESRGMLGLDFLLFKDSIYKWRGNINKKKYNPFNLVFGNFDELYYFNNLNKKFKKLDYGIYTLSNGFLNESWPKTEKLKKMFLNTVKSDFSIEDLVNIMKDEEKFPYEKLPHTNISKEMEYFLSSIFIKGEKYGTGTTTVITVDYDNILNFTEISYNNKKEIINRFDITIKL